MKSGLSEIFKPKARLLFCLLFVGVLMSCSNNTTEESTSTNPDKTTNAYQVTKLFNIKIGNYKDGVVSINLPSKKIRELYSDYVDLYYDDHFQLSNFGVEEINGLHFIRFYNNDRSVVSLGLYASSGSNILYTGKTTCRTKSCAHNDGCTPEGKHCTDCKSSDAPNAPAGDCLKISSTSPDEGNTENLRQI